MKKVSIFALAAAVVLAPVVVLSEEIEDVSGPAGGEMSSAAKEAASTAVPVSAYAETEKGILNVTTYPPGAEISLDGNIIGVSPISGMAVEVGGHAVRAERPWHYVKEVTITVEAGKAVDLHLSLVERENREGAEEFVTWWHKHRLLIILVGLGVGVLGAAIVIAVRGLD